MSVSAILIAALVMSVLGLIFGALLGVTGRVFKVPTNEKVEALRACLPGANCGACGFPGCDGYAAAVGEGKAEVGACAVGGPACAAKMAEIMGVTVNESVRMVASVACQGYGDHCKPKGIYEGMTDCVRRRWSIMERRLVLMPAWVWAPVSVRARLMRFISIRLSRLRLSMRKSARRARSASLPARSMF